MARTALARTVIGFFDRVNRRIPWFRLPRWLGVFNLLAYRVVLREQNLHDTWTPGGLRRRSADEEPDPSAVAFRTADGSWNDLDFPDMGKAGTRFGRNVPPDEAWPDEEPELMDPSPREISRKLMTRDEFRPATTLNLMAAAWIQFQTHDWFNHGQPPHAEDDLRIDLEDDDPWPTCPMRVPRTPPDPTRCPEDEGLPPTYVNTESHWWDGSNVYGSSGGLTEGLRTHRHGKLRVYDERLPVDERTQRVKTGFNDNWWLGLGMLHDLFTLEHNAICDRLLVAYPDWPDERLFQTARLVNSALMAKIHTVEWTPAITNHPALHIGMNANWWGLATERIHRLVGRIGSGDILSGVPGSPADHHGAPFQLTEEFVSVYRLHPLIPEGIEFRRLDTDDVIRRLEFRDVALEEALDVIDEELTVPDAWYSMGVAHPGAVCLHNYPGFLQDFTRPEDGARLDLAAVDILRDRERGIPRYNRFRRLIHMPPAESFDDITDNPEWARELEELYDGDVEKVDLMVGMFAETPPPGFGFSDTAFRVFILMASRRLKSDRFLSTDFRPEVYTPEGYAWVQDNTMGTILLRHHPELAPALDGVSNAFAPWNRVEGRG